MKKQTSMSYGRYKVGHLAASMRPALIMSTITGIIILQLISWVVSSVSFLTKTKFNFPKANVLSIPSGEVEMPSSIVYECTVLFIFEIYLTIFSNTYATLQHHTTASHYNITL